MMGKYLTVGMGASRLKDGRKAAIAAAQEAIHAFAKKPSFSLVFVNSDANPNEVCAGVNSVLGTNWIGVSADKQFNNANGYHPDTMVSVVSLQTDYLHFGVSVAPNYRAHPEKSAAKAAGEAIAACKADKFVDSYVQFTRAKKKDYGAIIRTPPYFLLAFLSGAQIKNGKVVPGHESEFISGVLSQTGPNIPMFGGSASSSFEDYFQGKASNFQFANGKVLRDAAVLVFVVSDLLFYTQVKHGYDASKQFAAITKLDKSGYDILELNGKEPIAEIARLLGMSKQAYLKKAEDLGLRRPFGLVQVDGTAYVKEALPNPDKKTLHSTFHLYPNSILNILEFNKKKTLNTIKSCLNEGAVAQKAKPALGLFCVCSGRRPLLKNIEQQELSTAGRSVPLFGFYSFSEVGSTQKTSAQSHSQTVTSLLLYDKLLSD
ncbi:MAG TPA: FIST N-terminal domain-containing protein [Candidatus Binatia bacterium]|nr:FIST N-terminal domain-containing protein [Candidatus Binatia bacterium]